MFQVTCARTAGANQHKLLNRPYFFSKDLRGRHMIEDKATQEQSCDINYIHESLHPISSVCQLPSCNIIGDRSDNTIHQPISSRGSHIIAPAPYLDHTKATARVGHGSWRQESGGICHGRAAELSKVLASRISTCDLPTNACSGSTYRPSGLPKPSTPLMYEPSYQPVRSATLSSMYLGFLSLPARSC